MQQLNAGRTRLSRWGVGGAVAGLMMGVAVAGWDPARADTAPVVKVVEAGQALPAGEREDSYAAVVERVSPAVVTVRSARRSRPAQQHPFSQHPFFEEFFGNRRMPEMPERREGGLGSGVIVTTDGYVLTNHHVVDGAEDITVELTDRRRFDAKVVGTDAPSDLAVLKIDGKDLHALTLGDSDGVRVGDVVLAVGNPLGIGQTVTLGIISAKGRATGLGDGSFEDFLQTDAPINRGNSGGALVNTAGELIGINSQILSPSGGNIGIGFAIPAGMARDVMTQLIEHGTVSRGMLGVTVQPVTSDIARSLGLDQVRGALVNDVNADGPAAKAGVRRGDVILSVDGTAIADGNALRNRVSRLRPGTSVKLEVARGGANQTLTVTLGELPGSQRASADRPSEPAGRFGLAVQPLTPELAEQLGVKEDKGLVVTQVDPNGPAAEAGIRQRDVILEAAGKPVTSVEQLRSALSAGEGPSLLLINRGGSNLFVTIEKRA